MQTIDWLIIAAYFVLSFGIAAYYAKRAGKDIHEFFLSGRNLPWWLAGTAMVATTFAADTPLAVTELVARDGIAGNWLWWNYLFGSMLTVFFFARLWRRAGVLTDVEFIELRYSGRPGVFLRGFRALYLGLFINTVIMGWVNVAMASILVGMFDIPEEQVLYYVFGAMLCVAVYSAMSGLWGVAVTDAVQFVLAMAGTIILAIVVLDLPKVGGVAGLKSQLPDAVFRFTPVVGSGTEAVAGGILTLSVSAFLAFVAVQWWASWYPGAEPGGGGYMAQRMMSAKDEKHSLLATLWFTIAHYCLRPWPWILVGLASLVLYPDLEMDDKKMGYVYAMRDFLPAGLKGLLVASFFAAYMSTIATHLNWGSSYVINDFYKRFVKKSASEKHYVLVSRLATLILMLASVLVTLIIGRITGAWEFIIQAGAGLGLVLILRFYWWRINAWSELAATIAPFFFYAYVQFADIAFPESLYYIVGFTTIIWVVVTFLTRPVDRSRLHEFYRRVRPGGVGWRQVGKEVPEVRPDSGYVWLLLDWVCGIVLVYTALFGFGKVIFGEYGSGFLLLLVGLIAAAIMYWDLNKRGWKEVTG